MCSSSWWAAAGTGRKGRRSWASTFPVISSLSVAPYVIGRWFWTYYMRLLWEAIGWWDYCSLSCCSSSNNWVGMRASNGFGLYCNGFGLNYKGLYSLGWLVGSQNRVVYHSSFSDVFLIPSPSSIFQDSWQTVDCLCTRRRWPGLPGTETISSAGGTWLLSHSKRKETFIDICSVIFFSLKNYAPHLLNRIPVYSSGLLHALSKYLWSISFKQCFSQNTNYLSHCSVYIGFCRVRTWPEQY